MDGQRLSVVIPALNESRHLPILFDSIAKQTCPPHEVVVADAGSTDGTPDIARRAGAIVVEGGLPAVGRNAGARSATGEIVLFLDADVVLAPHQLERAVAEFSERGLTVATAHIEPLEREAQYLLACEVANLYLDLMQYVVPHAPGFFILVRREAHEAVGGFDESLAMAEDHDYVRRVAELGKFRVLRSCPVRTSMRRIEKEGLLRLAFMYLYCEIHVVAGRRIREIPFDYEFGSFPETERRRLRDVLDGLRERMIALADDVMDSPGDVAERLRKLGSGELEGEAFGRALSQLSPLDVKRLEHYVRARTRLARLRGRRAAADVRSATEALTRSLSRLAAPRASRTPGGSDEGQRP